MQTEMLIIASLSLNMSLIWSNALEMSISKNLSTKKTTKAVPMKKKKRPTKQK
jgi:hypothetical protein